MSDADVSRPGRILDSHVHITDIDQVGYRWEGMEGVARATLPGQYMADTGSYPVNAFVFVEAGARPDQSLAEAQWIASLAQGGAPIAAIVAQADMRRGGVVLDELEPLSGVSLVRGIRWILEPPFETDPDCCVQPGFVEATRLLQRFGYTLDISVKNEALPNVIRLVQSCPDVSFVLDHIGKPAIHASRMEPWATQIRELAGCDNIVCKISGMPVEAGEGWTVDMLRPYVEQVAEAFGPKRILYGSDYPAQLPVGTFETWTAAIIAIMAECSPEEIDDYFYANAARTYRVEI